MNNVYIKQLYADISILFIVYCPELCFLFYIMDITP